MPQLDSTAALLFLSFLLETELHLLLLTFWGSTALRGRAWRGWGWAQQGPTKKGLAASTCPRRSFGGKVRWKRGKKPLVLSFPFPHQFPLRICRNFPPIQLQDIRSSDRKSQEKSVPARCKSRRNLLKTQPLVHASSRSRSRHPPTPPPCRTRKRARRYFALDSHLKDLYRRQGAHLENA